MKRSREPSIVVRARHRTRRTPGTHWRPRGTRSGGRTAAVASLLLLGSLVVPPTAAGAGAGAAAPAARDSVEVYAGDLTGDQLRTLAGAGLDREDVSIGRRTGSGTSRVEVVLSGLQARDLTRRGVDLDVKTVGGKTAGQRAAATQEKVFRPYSGGGNIREEILALAASHPAIATAVDIGKSVKGQPITAIRVSKNVTRLKDRQRPAVVYQADQHAREWITPEMVRRLLHHYVENYGENAEITKIVDTTDLWFVPVVNVDGYDFTFTGNNRLWRKNLRDNDGDGQTTAQDGVDLNRNFPYKFGYDNEGSSPSFTSQTYRGTAAASEPETRAQVDLYKRIRPKYAINWHSAAELLLYGVGWQTLTASPDDLIHKAMLGDVDEPAVPGYNPQLGAQLYTTNGDTDGQMENTFGTLTETPEMSTCETASKVDPDDRWRPEDCVSSFIFPDDEKLIAAEATKNFRYALSVAKSAHRPDEPASPVGRTVPDFDPDEFATSYGSSAQEAASVIRRSVDGKAMHYRINGGRTRTTGVREWRGGERFGGEHDRYFAEYRGTVRGQRPGDRVQVWFSGREGREKVGSAPFTYRVRDADGARVLVIADEDYTGINPTYPPGTDAPKYAQDYADAVRANKIKPLVWDIDKDGVPHDLGVLKHFKAAVWYLGDNRLTQDEGDDPVRTLDGPFNDAQVADRAKDLVLNVRSYLNEGGKLVHTGETAGYFGPLRQRAGGGIYYGLKGHPERPCVVISDYRDDCELLSDDFTQYYLGAWNRTAVRSPSAFTGTGTPFDGVRTGLDGAAANPPDEAGGFQVTSAVLPPDRFPLFRSAKAGDYLGATGDPLGTASAVTTKDTVLLGYGIEQAGSQDDRRALIGRALRHLLG